MKKKLTITISGEANSGKSTLTYYLKELLRWNGFYDIKSEGTSDFPNEVMFDEHMKENFQEVIEKMHTTTEIVVKEVQLPYDVSKRKEKMVNYLLRVQKALGTENKDMAEKQAEYFLENEEYLKSQDYNKVSTIYQLSLIH